MNYVYTSPAPGWLTPAVPISPPIAYYPPSPSGVVLSSPSGPPGGAWVDAVAPWPYVMGRSCSPTYKLCRTPTNVMFTPAPASPIPVYVPSSAQFYTPIGHNLNVGHHLLDPNTTPRSDNDHKCYHCNQIFLNRQELWRHIESTQHAAPLWTQTPYASPRSICWTTL
ncbi:hypothetical protein C8J56DRAFT_969783 [Mycena floridula]|nr:hypothetical protein C8J56DRAFT_987055 [Mycena floridula]KAJ7577802.1 hypothetical protein C8J56DRAFT_969783 [Mycena floridula]